MTNFFQSNAKLKKNKALYGPLCLAMERDAGTQCKTVWTEANSSLHLLCLIIRADSHKFGHCLDAFISSCRYR